ncbi:flagellar hook-length control protein FliK [Porticoccaceae bacterium]|nr:flagellar hook-length control protein FliK [Porticoccaceae bacterium]MDC3258856.1 flagellar hook-length control protein FliK [Porticoccaceae bacterium]
MLEFENIFTAKSTSPNASKLGGSAQKPDNKEVSKGAFQTFLEDSENSDIPAKIGNIPPVELAAKSEKKLRDLDGGSQLVLSGAEPTDDSITAFAVLQGIDPDVIALIVGGKIQPETSGEEFRASELPGKQFSKLELFKTEGEVIGTSKQELKPASSGISLEKFTSSGLGFKETSGLELIKVPKLPSGQPPLETGYAVASDKALTLDLLSKNSYKLDFNSDESDLSRTPLKSVEPTSNMEHKNGINLQVKNLASGVQKLAAIELGADAKEILSLAYDRRLTNRSAGTVSVPRTESQTHLVASYAPELRVDLTAKSLAESQPSPGQELIVRRQEQYMEVSRRLTEALGERLTAQITKGAWRVEMDLHPKSLGRIEINLEMKNGSLEAYFNPSQNITRELLQESFDKLKDVFAEHGIDSAYVGLGDGKNKDSDGNPTDEEFLAKTDKEAEVGSSLERVDLSNRLSLDGLDVQV